MWSEKHLPSIQKAQTNAEGKGLINLGARSQGVLEELEVAHIYIEQLHNRMKKTQDHMKKMQERIAKLESLMKK